jgi:hypothetical protein
MQRRKASDITTIGRIRSALASPVLRYVRLIEPGLFCSDINHLLNRNAVFFNLRRTSRWQNLSMAVTNRKAHGRAVVSTLLSQVSNMTETK